MLRAPIFRRVTAAMICLTMAISTTACAVYTPLDRDGVLAAGESRILLTERGTLELAPRIGTAVVAVDGRIRTLTDSTVEIALVQSVTRTGDTQQWVGELVVIPVSYVNGFRRRQPSVKRSALLAGGILGAVVLAAVGFSAVNSGSGGNTGGGGIPR